MRTVVAVAVVFADRLRRPGLSCPLRIRQARERERESERRALSGDNDVDEFSHQSTSINDGVCVYARFDAKQEVSCVWGVCGGLEGCKGGFWHKKATH